jgi:aprataxin
MSTTKPPAKRNAFTELMAPKPKAPISQAPQSLASKASQVIRGVWRGALIEYIEHPERFPTQVLRVTDRTVLIKDAFPKSTIHLLLLPRSPDHYLLHPHTAFEDPAFLAMMREEAAVAAKLAAAELARQLGSFSASNRARDETMGKGVPYDELPPGRDYSKEVRVGTHAHPSMAHLHVHIISRDMHSERAKHRKHYNSFTTPFFVPLADYPLAEDDVRRETGFQNGNLAKELVCWRCGKGFGNRFAELKRHLEEEFQAWRAE